MLRTFLDLHSTLRRGSWCSYFSGKGIKTKKVLTLVGIGVEELQSSLGFSDMRRTNRHAETHVEHVDAFGPLPWWQNPTRGSRPHLSGPVIRTSKVQ